jgi:hypothetical protein
MLAQYEFFSISVSHGDNHDYSTMQGRLFNFFIAATVAKKLSILVLQ